MGVWADSVRKLAEQRSGISVAEGFGLLDDEGYARALRMGAWFDDAAGAVAVALRWPGPVMPSWARFARALAGWQ